jgi:hypothetical protein
MRLFALNFLTLIACSILYPASCRAAITEEQPLSFGSFAIAKNDAVSTLIVPHVGGIPRATYKLFPLTRAQPGHYRLTAYPAFTPLMINISDFQLNLGASPILYIEDFTFDPVNTDASGAALLKIGATLKTSGLGGTYGDGGYSGTLNITVSW